MVKLKVYRMNPYAEEGLKENIKREILEFCQEEPLWVNYNLFKWYKEYVHLQRQHFQHLL
jgi:hypothetical protein